MDEELRRLREAAHQAIERGKLKPALEAYLGLEQLEPHEPSWSHHAADLHRRLEQRPEQIQALSRASEKYAKLGFLIKAVACCKMILELDPTHRSALQKLASLNAVPIVRGVPSDLQKQQQPQAPQQAQPARRQIMPLDIGPPEAAPAPLELPAARAEENEIELDLELPPSKEDAPVPPPPPITFRIPAPPPPADTRLRAIRALPTTPLFSDLHPRSMEMLIERTQLIRLAKDQILFREGDRGDALFVVVDGAVTVYREGPPSHELALLSDGAFFGEIALATDQPRSASVKAIVDTKLLAIDRATVNALIADEPQVMNVMLRFLRDRLVETLVRTSPLFSPFGGAELRDLGLRFRFLEVAGGGALVEQGVRSDGLYVLLAGRADVVALRDGQVQPLASLQPGDVFGEMSLLTQQAAVASVRTRSRCFVLKLPSADFQQVIMTHPQLLSFVGELAEQRQAKLSGAQKEEGFVEIHLELV